MKYVFAAAAALSIVTACNGAPPNEKILTDLCTDLFTGDSRSLGMISRDAGTDLDTFCGCFAARTLQDPSTIDLYKSILVEMTEIKASGEFDVEDVADQIEDRLESGAIDTFTENDFDDLGDYFQDLSLDIAEANGTCPVS